MSPTISAMHGDPRDEAHGCYGCGRDIAGKGEAHTAECRLARFHDAPECGHAWSTVDSETSTEDEIASGAVDPKCDRCGLTLSDIDLDASCDPEISVPISALRAVRDAWEYGNLATAITDLLGFLVEHESHKNFTTEPRLLSHATVKRLHANRKHDSTNHG